MHFFVINSPPHTPPPPHAHTYTHHTTHTHTHKMEKDNEMGTSSSNQIAKLLTPEEISQLINQPEESPRKRTKPRHPVHERLYKEAMKQKDEFNMILVDRVRNFENLHKKNPDAIAKIFSLHMGKFYEKLIIQNGAHERSIRNLNNLFANGIQPRIRRDNQGSHGKGRDRRWGK
jgi:hypothetical protein